MNAFNWSPGIGDPTIGGWVTVVLYFLAVVTTWKTTNIVQARERFVAEESYTWRTISIMFCALGINKQLDLQTAMTDLGRIIANHQGWYNERQTVQIWFIVGVATVCVLITCVLLTLSRRAPPPTWLALVGTATVLAFVLIRAASFHHIDRFLGATILGLRWNWVLEMGGISTVIVASEVRRRRLKTRLARELQRRVN